MPLIHLETFTKAAPQAVFDLSRSVDLHKASMLHHGEEVVDGVKEGLMNSGDTVTWKARHLFKNRLLKVHITEVNAPHSFTDEILEGDFKKMKHTHRFLSKGEDILMIDDFYFSSPYGILGQMVNALFLTAYMKRLLKRRNAEIKIVAEAALRKYHSRK